MEQKNVVYFQTKKFSEIKEAESGEVIIEGFASTKDIDRYRDIIEPKAFANALDLYMQNPIVLLQHNQNKPIGVVEEAKITRKGLKVRCKITNDIENVKDNIKNGVLRGFSIGFIVKAWKFKTINGVEVRVITELELLEISVVAVPANPFTLFQAVKKYFDNLETMEKENQTNEIKEEILDEKQLEENQVEEELEEENEEDEEKNTAEEKEDEVEEEKDGEEEKDEGGENELHNEVISEDPENSDETSEDGVEAETEEEASKGGETEDEGQEEDLKDIVPELLSIIEKQNEKIEELEKSLASVGVKKGLKTLPNTRNKQAGNNAWLQAFKEARKSVL